jgi:ssDNA-binding Zn-finger/Zn-ribbon topoisomerase 1
MAPYIQRMDDARNTKKIYRHQKRPRGDTKLCGKEMQKMRLRKMGIVNCRQIEQERDGWRRVTREALILLG